MPVSVITDSILNIKGEVEIKGEKRAMEGWKSKEREGANFKRRHSTGTEKNNTKLRITGVFKWSKHTINWRNQM